MDARKIQFLIAMQREIDKLEAQDGESTRVERLKSRFYDVMEVEDMVEGEEKKEESLLGKEANKETGLKNARAFPHKPKDVADFMKLFDRADGLKYLTHEFDEPDKEFDIRTFLKKANNAFTNQANKYKIPNSLYAVINQFAFDENPRWRAEIKPAKDINEGWSSEKWIKWSEAYGQHPMKNRDFANLVQVFKSSIRVKGNLQPIFEATIQQKLGKNRDHYNITFIDLDKSDFYTYLVFFTSALEILFSSISFSPTIKIRYNRGHDGDYRTRIIEISQASLPKNKPLEELIEKYKNSGGELWEIRNKLFGYCDWYIESVWDDKPTRIHLLKEGMISDTTEVEVADLQSLSNQGFTHTLTFYV